MKSYEGTCRYCGVTDIIMAESQVEADKLTSESCLCGGYQEELRHNAWAEAIVKVWRGDERYNMDKMSSEMKKALAETGEAIYRGTYGAVKIKCPNGETIDMISGHPCSITRTCKNQIDGAEGE